MKMIEYSRNLNQIQLRHHGKIHGMFALQTLIEVVKKVFTFTWSSNCFEHLKWKHVKYGLSKLKARIAI